MSSADKLHKIRQLIERLRTRFVSVPLEENLSVDEQIVPFKGRSCLRQYNPKKPHKWGYKIWVLCGASRYAYDFERYTGRSDNTLVDGEEDCGASGNVVIRLSRVIPTLVNHKDYFDNFFTSPDLQLYLAKKAIWSISTVCGNRILQCSLKSDVDLRKLGCGAFNEKVAVIGDIETVSVQWLDNNSCYSNSSRTKVLACCRRCLTLQTHHSRKSTDLHSTSQQLRQTKMNCLRTVRAQLKVKVFKIVSLSVLVTLVLVTLISLWMALQ